MNSSDRKSIRLEYVRMEENGWYLVRGQASDGVDSLVRIPPFVPGSTDAKGQHIRDVMQAIEEAKFGGGSRHDTLDCCTHVVVLVLKSKIERNKNHGGPDDEDHLAHVAMEQECAARQSPELRQYWFDLTNSRVNSPELLRADKQS